MECNTIMNYIDSGTNPLFQCPNCKLVKGIESHAIFDLDKKVPHVPEYSEEEINNYLKKIGISIIFKK
jgi:hypothetical protein